MYKGINRTGMMIELIASGSRRKRSGRFVARQAQSKIKMDRRKIQESYIRRNKLDITVNDRISSLLARF